MVLPYLQIQISNSPRSITAERTYTKNVALLHVGEKNRSVKKKASEKKVTGKEGNFFYFNLKIEVNVKFKMLIQIAKI